MDGLLIALFVIIGYVILVYALKGMGILEKYNMSNWGPFVMWRTKRGRALIDRLARPKRFWEAYAFVGKFIVIGVMISMLALLLWEATIVPTIPAESAPSPEMMLGIPGLNPIIPIWYGILGLVIAVLVHEFAHGILTRVGDMKVKAMGIVWMVIPMGAFVEPDEEALATTTKKKRTSVYTVGPSTNIILAFICAILFSTVMVASAVPAQDGPVVYQVEDGSPASMGGLVYGSQIISINGTAVASDGFETFDAPYPGNSVPVVYYLEGEQRDTTVAAGVYISSLVSGLPAEQAGVRAGMILESLNGVTITNLATFREVLASIAPGTEVSITALTYDAGTGGYVRTLDSTITPISRSGSGTTDAYIGVYMSYMGASANSPQAIVDLMAHPFAGADSVSGFTRGILTYISLPFQGLQPLQSPMSDLFVPTGIFAWMSPDLFWIVANSLYWIFWINLMLGMTNALPAVPLDGGYLFRDWFDTIVSKVKKSASQEQRDTVVNSITWALAFLVLFLVLWQLVGPRIL